MLCVGYVVFERIPIISLFSRFYDVTRITRISLTPHHSYRSRISPLENQRSNTGTKIRDFLRDTKSLSLDNMCCTKEEDEEEEWADVRHALETGASMKKRHEVVKMAPIVNMLAKQCKAETVFDIGSGQGHLYVHYHNTRCVESKTPHTHKQRSYVGFKVFLTCCGC